MLTPDNKRIQNSNWWFPYDCYGRHDRYSRCDRRRKKRVIAAMTCFDLMAVISAKTGLKPGSQFNAWWRHSTNDSCSSLVSFLLSLSFAKENEEIARVNGNKGFGFEVYFKWERSLVPQRLENSFGTCWDRFLFLLKLTIRSSQIFELLRIPRACIKLLSKFGLAIQFHQSINPCLFHHIFIINL